MLCKTAYMQAFSRVVYESSASGVAGGIVAPR